MGGMGRRGKGVGWVVGWVSHRLDLEIHLMMARMRHIKMLLTGHLIVPLLRDGHDFLDHFW